MSKDPSKRARSGGVIAPQPAAPETLATEETAPLTQVAVDEREDGDDGARLSTTAQTAKIISAEDPDAELELLTAGGQETVIGPVPDRERTSPPTRGLAFPRLYIDDRIGRIVLSVVLAILLWFYVLTLTNPTSSTLFTDLPVDIRGIGNQLKVVNTIPPVNANVSAPQSVLASLGKSDINPYVDLTGLPEGVHEVPVKADIGGGAAKDANIIFSPQQVQVQLEVQVTRVFSVAVQTSGTPAFGYAAEPAQVEPANVQATGPKDAMARTTHVVVNVDVDGKASTQQGLKVPVALDAKDQEVKGLTFDPPAVQVEVPIKLLLNYKAVPVRVPLLGQPAPGYGVSLILIDPTNVAVCCSPDLETLQFLNTRAVPITGTTSTVMTTTQLILPQGMELYPGQPQNISVTVQVQAQQTTEVLSLAPTLDGLAPGLTASVSPDRVEVTLAGTLNQLQSLNPTDIHARVNMQGHGPGTYVLTPEIDVPDGVKVLNVTPAQVTVTVASPTRTPAPNPTPTHTPVPPESPTPIPSSPTPSATPVPPTRTPTPQVTRAPIPTPTVPIAFR